jgi:hypothetical protein
MSKEHPFILFAGNFEFGDALSAAADRRGWFMMQAEDDLEVLAMHTVYMPDVVILDQSAAFAGEVEFHLRSINAKFVLMDQLSCELDLGSMAILDMVALRFGYGLAEEGEGKGV